MKHTIFLILLSSVLAFSSCSNRNKSAGKVIDNVLNQNINLADDEFNTIIKRSKDDALFVLDSCLSKGSSLLSSNDAKGNDLYYFAISKLINHDLQFIEFFENYAQPGIKLDIYFKSLSKIISEQRKYNYIDSCFKIGIQNFEKQNPERAVTVGKNTMKLAKELNFFSNTLLSNYLSYFNTMSDVLTVVDDSFPRDYQYNSFAQVLMSLDIKSRIIHDANLIRRKESHYCDEAWLNPNSTTLRSFSEISGLEGFSPIPAYKLISVDESEIISMTPEIFVKNVRNSMMIMISSRTKFHERILGYNWIPEIWREIDRHREKTDFEIASQKDDFISKLLNIRDKYMKSNLYYISNWYNIQGRGYVSKVNYDMNTQTLKVHIYLDKGNHKDTYAGTIDVHLTLNEAQQLFASSNVLEPVIDFIVSPGTNRIALGIQGGCSYDIEFPSLYLAKEPIISISNNQGFKIKVQTVGWKGNIWSGANVGRWDKNKNTWPDSYNVRMINSKRI